MKSAEELQHRLYHLLERLQEQARQLPLQFQQRMPYELLSGLANCLLNETIFKIVEGLMEIQQVTEKQLLQHRLQLLHRHRGSTSPAVLRNRNSVRSYLTYAEKEALGKNPEQQAEKELLLEKQKEELKKADMNLIQQLDQVVTDQQTTLEKAGVPGFYVSTNSQEIRVQMYLLDFILKLNKDEDGTSTS
nr:EOG090X0GJG [Leptodora kindtii]